MKKSTIITCSLVIVLIASVLNIENISELIEHHFIKGRVIHSFFQTAKDKTFVPMHSKLIVFQHIPRTCGDSVRTHLFYNTTIDFQSLSIDDLNSSKAIAMLENKKDVLINNASVIKGYFSSHDLTMLRYLIHPRKLDVFTILRHPYERLLSLKNFMSSPDTPLHVFIEQRNPDWLLIFFNNSMTFQLGGSWHNDNNKSIHDILDLAKNNLNKMKYVGFFEFLRNDFDDIHKIIFPDVVSPPIYRNIFNLGTLLTQYRLRVLRYSSKLTQPELNMLHSFCEYDLLLYQWALEKFHPNERLYNTISEYFQSIYTNI